MTVRSFFCNDNTSLSIKAIETKEWNTNNIFNDLNSVSNFFKNGSVGFSPIKNKTNFNGLKLNACNWYVSLLKILKVSSSFFKNEKKIPKGSVVFDNTLLMKNIKHEWIGLRNLI